LLNQLNQKSQQAAAWACNFQGIGMTPDQTTPQDMCVRGCLFEGFPSACSSVLPLSVGKGTLRSWKGRNPGGDYMSGGFFRHNGLNYLAQWDEPDGIRANIVHYQPQPRTSIP
jgi:hypothetical protein